MGSRRVGLPWACEPTARRVRSEGHPCSLHQSRNAPSKCFERRAPRSVPNTARSAPSSGARLPLGRAEAHWAAFPLRLLDCGRVRSSKSPDVKQAQAKTLKISSGRLQERRVKGLTSLEKLCDKLGGSAEWPGLFNRRFLSQEAEPRASSGGFAAPTNSPFAPWLVLYKSRHPNRPERPRSRGIPVVVPIACESLMAAIMLPSGYCRKADRSATGSAYCGGGIRAAPESSGRGRRPAGSAPHPG